MTLEEGKARLTAELDKQEGVTNFQPLARYGV